MPALRGDSLYHILDQAQNFHARKFTAVSQSQEAAGIGKLFQQSINGLGDAIFNLSNTNKQSKLLALESLTGQDGPVLTDIFDREIADAGISTGQSNDGKAKAPIIAGVFARDSENANTASKFGDRIIINYKNEVQEKETEKDSNVFYDKLNTPKSKGALSKFNGEFNPSINSIVEYISFQTGPLKISYADFLYCKKLGNYPNNRLIILRRFNSAVADDLLDSPEMNSQSPISALVTWFDEFPMEIEFGEKWSQITNGLMTQIQKVGKGLTGASTAKESKGDQCQDDIGNPWLASLWYGFLDKGLNAENKKSSFTKMLPSANPNLVREAMYRACRSLKSSIKFELKFEYVLRYFNEIDPHIAMHNIIANIIRMGTSTSYYVYPKPTSLEDAIPLALKELNEGNIIKSVKTVIGRAKTFVENLITEISKDDAGESTGIVSSKDAKDNVSGFNLGDELKNYSARIISLYRFQLTAALQADTGMPSGVWHVTVGNPFNPIVTVGDLVIKNQVKLEFGKELSYNDFPTEVYATFSFESAKNRGSQELERIFNAGRGRIYVYPSADSNPDTFSTQNSNTKPEGNATITNDIQDNISNASAPFKSVIEALPPPRFG